MYLLDTNILSEFIRRRPDPHLIERIRSQPPDNLFSSSVCVMELRMGSALRNDFDVFWKRVCREILSRVRIMALHSPFN